MKNAQPADIHSISKMSGLTIDQTRRGIEWLLGKNILIMDGEPRKVGRLGPAGLEAARHGLPERRFLDMLKVGTPVPKIKEALGSDYGAALGICAKNRWISVKSGIPNILSYPDTIPGEDEIQTGMISGDTILQKRPGYVTWHTTAATYSLSSSYDTMTIRTGLDVEAPVSAVTISRTHPLNDVISKIREAFVTLGFTEIHGDMVQSGFWNFDALFTPQDHPAREMQDTFYLINDMDMDATHKQVKSVEDMHRTGWNYEWDEAPARKAVLRTHTTCVTIRHLAKNHDGGDSRVFSVGRVFRNEKPSYKHLVEFNQIEGVVAGSRVSLRDLMGIQKRFYSMMGIKRIKFWPTFFPYTEPSLQSMVYNETLGKWVELFGMGMFRPEVTRPLGIRTPVLAWGGGIERMAMLLYMMDDVREFYENSMEWLRSQKRCR